MRWSWEKRGQRNSCTLNEGLWEHPSGEGGFGGQHSGYFWVLLTIQTGTEHSTTGSEGKHRPPGSFAQVPPGWL